MNWGVGACEKISFKREGAPKKTRKRINWLKFQHRENKSFFFSFFLLLRRVGVVPKIKCCDRKAGGGGGGGTKSSV